MIVLFILSLIILILINKNNYFNYKNISNKYNLIKINYLYRKNNKVLTNNLIILKEDIEILKLFKENYINKKEIE